MYVGDKPFEEQFRWTTLAKALVWRPKPGDSIAGYFKGIVERTGRYGPYEAVVVDTPDHGLLVASGSVLIATVATNNVPRDQPIRITFVGKVQVISDPSKWWKKFEVQAAVSGT